MNNRLYDTLIKLLIEKGGTRKGTSGDIKFYGEDLMLKNIKTKAEYKICQINDEDPNNLIFTVERYNSDGSRKEKYDYHQKEIIKDFEIV